MGGELTLREAAETRRAEARAPKGCFRGDVALAADGERGPALQKKIEQKGWT